MGRKKKPSFVNAKMFSARVEQADYDKFEYLLKARDGKSLQEMMNLFVVNYVSGNLVLSGTTLINPGRV